MKYIAHLTAAAVASFQMSGCQQQKSIFSEQPALSVAAEPIALPPEPTDASTTGPESAPVAPPVAQAASVAAAISAKPMTPPMKPVISSADADKVTSRAKNALAELATSVEAAAGDCKKMAATLVAFSQTKQSLFTDMKTIETKLTAEQRKEIEAKYQTDIKEIGARLTKPLGACTSDPDLIAAMKTISQNGSLGSGGQAAAAAAAPVLPTVTDPAAMTRLDKALAAWAQTGTTLATGITNAAGDCNKVLNALKAFTPGVPAMMAELQASLPKATSADLEMLAKKYEPQMSAMEKVLGPNLKSCETDPQVAAEMKKLPRMKKQ